MINDSREILSLPQTTPTPAEKKANTLGSENVATTLALSVTSGVFWKFLVERRRRLKGLAIRLDEVQEVMEVRSHY